MTPARPSAVAALATLAVLALPAGCTTTRPEGDAIVVGMANSPTNLDPRVGSDEASQKAHQLLYGSLLRIDDDLEVVPDLAASLETPDPLTYVVRLRRGVLFHDGRELTSADVAYTFSSFLDPAFVGRSGAYRQLLASVEPTDRYTVVFRLKSPFASFPVNLVMGIVEAGSGGRNALQPVGTGPYRIERFVRDDRLVLRPFDRHFRGRPRNGGVVLKVVPDDTMRGLELRKGTVDIVVNDLAPDVMWQLRQEGRLQVAETPGTDYAYMGLNLRDPVLSHLRVRQAIGHAVDRRAIVTYLRRGFAHVAVGIVPPMSWAFEPAVFDFTYDPERAKQLLDEAGYPDPDGPGPQVRFQLSLKTSTSEVYRIQAAVIQHDLAAVGIGVDVRSGELQTLLADAARGNVELYTLQWVGVTDPDMLRRVYHSKQAAPAGLNRVHYVNPEVDRLIDAAAESAVPGERKRLYGEAQRLIAEDVPYISLWTKTNVAVYQPDLRGVRLSPTADFSFLANVERVGVPAASASRE